MRLADQTVTITRMIYDGAQDKDVPHTQTVRGVSWHGQLKTAAGTSGLTGAALYRCRIPAKAVEGTLQAAPGDKIIHLESGTKATILAVHDSRSGRASPHWYVEAS